jgi:hypothetical protein
MWFQLAGIRDATVYKVDKFTRHDPRDEFRDGARCSKLESLTLFADFRHERQSIGQQLRDDLSGLAHLSAEGVAPLIHGRAKFPLERAIEGNRWLI